MSGKWLTESHFSLKLKILNMSIFKTACNLYFLNHVAIKIEFAFSSAFCWHYHSSKYTRELSVCRNYLFFLV